MLNILEKFSDEQRKEIGDIVIRNYEADYASLSEYRENAEQWVGLMAALREDVVNPWPKAANVKLPMLVTACLQFQARASAILVPPTKLAKTQWIGSEDLPKAQRHEKYFNFYLQRKMKGWEREQDAMLMRVAATGTIFKKTYKDYLRNVVKSELCTWDSCVIDYNTTSPDNIKRVSYELFFSASDLLKRQKAQIFAFNSLDDFSRVDKGEENDEGVKKEDTREDEDKPFFFIEQHATLPFALDPDGNVVDSPIEFPFIITVDKGSRRPVRVVPNWDDNGDPINYTTVYNLLPNPKSGVYGWGFGMLLGDLNETANTIINQLINAGHLATNQGGFINKRAGFKRGDLAFKLGEYKQIDMPADDIRKHVFNWEFREPSQTLFMLLGMMFEKANEVSTVSEITTGQMPPKDTAATAIVRLIEEGRQVFAAIYRRLHRSQTEEFDKINTLIADGVDIMEYAQVLGDDAITELARPILMSNEQLGQAAMMAQQQGPEMFKKFTIGIVTPILKGDFASVYDIRPVSDPNVTSQAEEITRNQFILQDIMTDPTRAQNPQVLYAARRRLYLAAAVPNIDEVLPPPPPPQPPQDFPPIDEEARVLMEQDSPVLDQQDHAAHLQSHQIFLQSLFASRLTPQGKKLMDGHIMQHNAALYKQEAQRGIDAGRMAGMGRASVH